MASLLEPPRNKIIPLEVAGVIIESYDSTLNIVEESSQIYGKALDGKTIVVKYKNGNHYKGEFTNGLLHGQGTFYWTDGVVFTGTFQDNKIIGEGRYDFPDGSFYEGEVVLGLRHGRGIFVTAGEECVYEGEWVSGRKHGQGVMRHKNGTVYEGEFQKGVKHGFGKMVFPSGNYYEGQWANDVKEGQGTMYWVNLNEKYTGSWSQNKQHGWGTHIWLEAKGDGKFLRNRYEGEWRNGLRNGFGVFYYSNGSKYEGEWVDGLKDGFAIFTYEDGRVFKGLYKNDKMIPNVSKDSVLGDIDLNTSQSRPALPPGQSQVDNNNGSLSKQQTLAAVDKVSRKGSRKQTSTPLVPAQDESRELHGNEIGANPYDAMLDITDLLAEEDEDVADVEIRDVKNLLLRYHSSMKAWYRLYTSKQQVNPEESFALSSKMFWKMLRDAKVLSPKVTISSFNRLFMRGSKNTFTLQTSQEELRKNLLIAKREFLDNLSDSDRDTSEVKVDTPEEDEVFLNEIKVDVHDENKVLFFRHFVDALVRVSYLKYGGAPDFAKKIEKVLVKVKNALENKKKSKTQVEEEHFLMRMRGVAEPLKDQIKALFQRFPSKEQTFAFDTIDYTMTIKDIVSLFEQCGIIQDEESRELVLHAAERVNDPEDCCISLPSPNEGNNKEKTVSSKNDLDRMEKLGDLLTSEVIFLEFYDILLIALFRHEPPAVKDEEIRRRLAHTLSIMESIGKDTNEEKKDLAGVGPEVNWPYSDKDYMSDHLTTEKEKREMQLAILKQKKLEREHEDRETKTMEREDFDIGDEYLKRPQTKQSYESGEYAESYNDF